MPKLGHAKEADPAGSGVDGPKRQLTAPSPPVLCYQGARASVPIPKFASACGTLSCELRNQRDTSNSMTLVPLLNPKFAIGLAAR
jgi:hypothetical protein